MKLAKRNNRLSYEEMILVNKTLQLYVARLTIMDTHCSKCIAAVLVELITKVQRSMAGIIKPEGYKQKLSPAQVQAIYYMQNELRIHLDHPEAGNSMFRLVAQNI